MEGLVERAMCIGAWVGRKDHEICKITRVVLTKRLRDILLG